MAIVPSGVRVSWGIPDDGKTAADALVTGIVQDFSVSTDGNVTEITDEDGDFVARVDHGEKNEISFSSLVVGTSPTLPVKGAPVTFSGAIAGVAVNTGLCRVESAEIAYAGTSTTTVSITITHYPDMSEPV